MTRQEIIRELIRKGWRRLGRKKNRWASPYHKRIFQDLDLRGAASIEMLSTEENLSPNS